MHTERETVLGMKLDAIRRDDVVARVADWCAERTSRYVCLANVHMVMEAWDAEQVRAAINAADLVVPDGRPLLWLLRRRGHAIDNTVRGGDLVLRLCRWAARREVPVGFFGGLEGVAEAAAASLARHAPGLRVTFLRKPPMLSRIARDDSLAAEINASGTAILFVGLGCPKQELWMASHAGAIRATMIGVGAAFDFHAGTVREAPRALQKSGLEWAFRLAMEPRRLWRRYLKHNPRFVYHVLARGPRRA